MKLQFSLATILLLTTAMSIVAAVSVSMPVAEPILKFPYFKYRPPNFHEVALRFVEGGTAAVALIAVSRYVRAVLVARRCQAVIVPRRKPSPPRSVLLDTGTGQTWFCKARSSKEKIPQPLPANTVWAGANHLNSISPSRLHEEPP
jgi:hypothetical protein